MTLSMAVLWLIQYANQPGATLDGLKAELAKFEASYASTPPVPAKFKLLSDFLRSTYASIQAGLIQRTQQAAREAAAAAEQRAAEVQRNAQHVRPPLP
jgi:hypothetical protein